MFEEASQFAVYLRRLQDRITQLQDDSEGQTLVLHLLKDFRFRDDVRDSKYNVVFFALYF